MKLCRLFLFGSLLIVGCRPTSPPAPVTSQSEAAVPSYPVANGIVGFRIQAPSPSLTGLPIWHHGDDTSDGRLTQWPNPLDWEWNLPSSSEGMTVEPSGDGRGLTLAMPETWSLTTAVSESRAEFTQTIRLEASPNPISIDFAKLPENWTKSDSPTDWGTKRILTGPSGRQIDVEFRLPPDWTTEEKNGTLSLRGQAPAEIGITVRLRLPNASISKAAPSMAELEIDGPDEDREHVAGAIRTLRAQLARSGRPSGPFGLTSDRFEGRVFWDADLWVLPACLILDPPVAKLIAEFRLNSLGQAAKNYKLWREAGMPIARGTLPATQGIEPGIKFPWESDASGRESSPTETRFQDHVTASVMLGLDWASAFGLVDSAVVNSAGRQAANFYLSRSEVGLGNQREIRGTVSPSERHVADNDLFTNVMAEWCVNRFLNRAETFARPKDETTYMTFDGDIFGQYQQAAALLAIFPAQDRLVESESTRMYDRFSKKVTEYGPAMSDAIHAIVAARMGQPDVAYKDWQQSWTRFTDENGYFFEKQPNRDTIFLTGLAANLNAVLYGFLGLRLDRFEPNAPWKLPLANGYWISSSPHLPKAWKSITLKNIQLGGQRFTIRATHDRLDVTKSPDRPEELPAKRQ